MESVKMFLGDWLKRVNDVVPISTLFTIITLILFVALIFAGVWITWYVAMITGREFALIVSSY